MSKKLLIASTFIICCSAAWFDLANAAAPQPPMPPKSSSVYAGPEIPAGYSPSEIYKTTPAPTPEEQQAIEELQQFAKGFDEYKASLPEDERKKLDADVEAIANRMQTRMDDMLKNDPTLEDRLNKQDPEALDLFFQNVMGPEIQRAEAEQAKQQPAMPPEVGPSTPAEASPMVPEKPEAKPEKEKIKKTDVEIALKLVRKIGKYLKSFKEKANMSIKFPGYYKKWAEEERLEGFTKELTWEKFNEKLELLMAKFKELERQDPDTKQYTHLGNLIENEALFKELEQFKNELGRNEGRIVVPDVGLGELNTASKDAARETINLCIRGITKLQEKIMALMGKYEKTAKKISEEKEKQRQQAEQEAKKHRHGYVYPIGAEDTGYAPYYPDAVGPYSPYTPWESPSASSHKITPPSIEKPEQKKSEDGKKGGAPRESKPTKSSDEDALDSTYDQFLETLSDIKTTIDTSAALKNFGDYITKPHEVGTDMKAAGKMHEVQEALTKLTSLVNRRGKSRLPRVSPTAKNNFIKQLNDALMKDEDAAPLRKLVGEIESIEKNRGRVPKLKQYMFFGDEVRSKLQAERSRRPESQADEFAQVNAANASIPDLLDNYKALTTAIEDLKKVKQRAPSQHAASGSHREVHQPRTESAEE